MQRPAEIVNYRTMGDTPALLGGALAVGAVVALGLTLITSVRRRRRELALLKTLGFTRRQLAAAVAWQASVAVAIGAVIGIPVGIVIGRALWDRFATALHVVPEPTVPAVTIALIGLGVLVLANVVATIPGRQAAARTPPYCCEPSSGVAEALRVARYRFRATFRHRRGGLIAIVLLVGLIGGLAIGAIADACRTQSSFPAFLASTTPSQLSVESFGVNTGASKFGIDGPTSPATLRALADLPHVEHAESEALVLAAARGTRRRLAGRDPKRNRRAVRQPRRTRPRPGPHHDHTRPAGIRDGPTSS